MSLGPGTRVGSYEIVSVLGEGGMGQVWRACDTKLGRDVAIKILPSSLTSDPDRLARFAREAQLLASLNHPNIAGIYHVEEVNGIPAIVMELGERSALTLSRDWRLVRRPREITTSQRTATASWGRPTRRHWR